MCFFVLQYTHPTLLVDILRRISRARLVSHLVDRKDASPLVVILHLELHQWRFILMLKAITKLGPGESNCLRDDAPLVPSV